MKDLKIWVVQSTKRGTNLGCLIKSPASFKFRNFHTTTTIEINKCQDVYTKSGYSLSKGRASLLKNSTEATNILLSQKGPRATGHK